MSSPDIDTAGSDEASLLRGLVDHQSAMLAYWDAQQRCRFANRAYRQWFGVDPAAMIGRDMQEFLGPLYALNLPYIRGVLRGERQEFEREIPDPHGGPSRHSLAQYLPDIVDGSVRGFFVLVTDVTRLKEAEAALLKVERQLQAGEHLVARGTLPAGIAHEINNPLANVSPNLELAPEALSSPVVELADIVTELSDARAAATRVKDIVRSLKFLAHGDGTQQEVVDMRDVLDRSIEFSGAAVRYRARVERAYEGEASVRGGASQLVQVFVNLLTNAAQAMEGSPRGLITVRLRTAGESVAVEVTDTGCGIPAALFTRVFEPFFTTKEVGVGMGLGLPISASIVRGLGGQIACASEVGRGTTFTVTLPRHPGASTASLRAVSDWESALGSTLVANDRASSAKVLVIDDDPSVARILARIVAKHCDVVVKTNAFEACALLLDQSQRFEVVFCDLMMPGMNGDVLYRRVASERPELARRFVIMTGGAFTSEGRQFLDSVSVPIIDKPFDVALLRRLLGRYLSGR